MQRMALKSLSFNKPSNPLPARTLPKHQVADKPWQVAAKTALAQTVSLQSCIYMLQPECCLLSSNVM